jgi:hypothetical protein
MFERGEIEPDLHPSTELFRQGLANKKRRSPYRRGFEPLRKPRRPARIRLPPHDPGRTMTLAEVASSFSTIPEVIIARVRAGSLPWPIKGPDGKAVRPNVWLVAELLLHQEWKSATCQSEQRRFELEAWAQRQLIYQKHVGLKLPAEDTARRDNVISITRKEVP